MSVVGLSCSITKKLSNIKV